MAENDSSPSSTRLPFTDLASLKVAAHRLHVYVNEAQSVLEWVDALLDRIDPTPAHGAPAFAPESTYSWLSRILRGAATPLLWVAGKLLFARIK
jgi:hypothetical protein